MLNKFFLSATFALSLNIAFSQDFGQRFNELFAKEDTAAQALLLKEWEAAYPQDPEMFIACFNHFIARSRKSVITLGPDYKGNDALAVNDSSGKPVAFIYSNDRYDNHLLEIAFRYLDRGIELHPRRLDMRFGKIQMLGKINEFERFTREILSTIEYGNRIDYAWLWKEGEPIDDPVNVFLDAMQGYNLTLYNTEDDDLLPFIREISGTLIRFHPGHVESLSNIALTYVIEGEYDRALPYLLKAVKLAPEDMIILNNLAETYKRKGDNANARIYYEKMISSGTPEEAEYARKKIAEL